jgi:hypothetical protein
VDDWLKHMDEPSSVSSGNQKAGLLKKQGSTTDPSDLRSRSKVTFHDKPSQKQEEKTKPKSTTKHGKKGAGKSDDKESGGSHEPRTSVAVERGSDLSPEHQGFIAQLDYVMAHLEELERQHKAAAEAARRASEMYPKRQESGAADTDEVREIVVEIPSEKELASRRASFSMGLPGSENEKLETELSESESIKPEAPVSESESNKTEDSESPKHENAPKSKSEKAAKVKSKSKKGESPKPEEPVSESESMKTEEPVSESNKTEDASKSKSEKAAKVKSKSKKGESPQPEEPVSENESNKTEEPVSESESQKHEDASVQIRKICKS